MKGIIICGGKGTRMGNISVPKSLLEIGGKPLIQHQIEWFVSHNIKEIIVLAGDKARQIKTFLDDYQTEANVIFQIESFPLGTAGALKSAERFIGDEPFVVIYGDKMHDLALDKMIEYHFSKPSVCTIGIHPTMHMHDSDLLDMDDNGRLIAVFPKPHDSSRDYRNLTNISVYILTPCIFQYITPGTFADFARDILPRLIKQERVYGYLTAEYMRDIGTPERLKEVQKDWGAGKITNWHTKHRAIFLDRDGVIIQRVDGHHGDGWDIRTPDELELFSDTVDAVKTINNSMFLAIIITNQPGIAKNMFTMEALKQIHNRIESLLGKGGAKLDAIFFCPHHPDRGWPDENPIYKVDCECRKPKPGLILQAAEQFNIDLAGSYMVGDTWRDIECGKRAGVKTVALLQGDSEWKGYKADFTFDNLSNAINYIMEGERDALENNRKDKDKKTPVR
jgi:histidinol-phosphate phosphatase family protein